MHSAISRRTRAPQRERFAPRLGFFIDIFSDGERFGNRAAVSSIEIVDVFEKRGGDARALFLFESPRAAACLRKTNPFLEPLTTRARASLSGRAWWFQVETCTPPILCTRRFFGEFRAPPPFRGDDSRCARSRRRRRGRVPFRVDSLRARGARDRIFSRFGSNVCSSLNSRSAAPAPRRRASIAPLVAH